MICEIAQRFEKSKQVYHVFFFIWNLYDPGSKAAGKRIEICCKDLSKFYPSDLNEKELLEEMHLLDRLKCSNSLFGRDKNMSFIALLNEMYEKGLQTILPQICVVLRLFVSIPVTVSLGKRLF